MCSQKHLMNMFFTIYVHIHVDASTYVHVHNIHLSVSHQCSNHHSVWVTKSYHLSYPSLQCVANAFSMFGCKHMLDIGFVDTSIQAIFPTTAGLNCWKMRGVVRIPTHPLYTLWYMCVHIRTTIRTYIHMI